MIGPAFIDIAKRWHEASCHDLGINEIPTKHDYNWG